MLKTIKRLTKIQARKRCVSVVLCVFTSIVPMGYLASQECPLTQCATEQTSNGTSDNAVDGDSFVIICLITVLFALSYLYLIHGSTRRNRNTVPSDTQT